MLVIIEECVCLIRVFNIFPKEKQLKLLTKETKQFSLIFDDSKM